MDALLQWIVNNVETGQLQGGILTVVVPGGTFTGELISTWRFVEIMGETIRSGGAQFPTNGGDRSSSDVPQVPVENSEYLHFLLPLMVSQIASNEPPVAMPALRVRLEQISAWTTGGFQIGEEPTD